MHMGTSHLRVARLTYSSWRTREQRKLWHRPLYWPPASWAGDTLLLEFSLLCVCPVVPWWDAARVIVVTSFILDFLCWSVSVCCHTEQNRVIVSASCTACALQVCECTAHSKDFLHSCVFLPCWAICVTCPSLFSALTLFPSCHRLCASFHALFSYVCSFSPLVSFRDQVVSSPSLCWGSRHSFLLSRGPQLISSPLVPSILQRGKGVLSSQILNLPYAIFLFPLDPFSSWRQERSLAESQCYDP